MIWRYEQIMLVILLEYSDNLIHKLLTVLLESNSCNVQKAPTQNMFPKQPLKILNRIATATIYT